MSTHGTLRVKLCLGVFILSAATYANAADWPGYRRDNARSGATKQNVGSSFSLQWVHSSVYAPLPGWPAPATRPREGFTMRQRVGFDDAFQVAVVGGKVYFGSSVDNKVYAIDVRTGKECWSLFTGGPVRLAPTLWDNKVYVGSDDGFVYCLNAGNGDVIWKIHAGTNDEKLLGHGRMISRWPIRTGVLIDEGIAYFGAGIFPHDNIFLYAVEAKTGKVIWKNDTISESSAYRNEFTPQGYMLASRDKLFIPCGRDLPGAFDKATGKMLFKSSYGWRGEEAGGIIGGTYALLADDQIYTGTQNHMLTLSQNNGRSGFGWFPGRRLAVVGTEAYLATGSKIVAMDRTTYAEASRKRNSLEFKIKGLTGTARTAAEEELKKHDAEKIAPTIKWSITSDCDAELIVSGDMVFVGGERKVCGLNRQTGSIDWSVEVEGKASGLAICDGMLIVSTDSGKVYCFAGEKSEKSQPQKPVATERVVANPWPEDEFSGIYKRAAESIIAESGVTKGFCLVLGAEKGRLAYELAKRTDLHIIGIEPDASKVRQARLALDAAGLYGQRVIIDQGELSNIPYSNYFANLIVSDTLLITGKIPGDAENIARHLKPCGGVLCLGMPTRTGKAEMIAAHKLEQWTGKLALGPCTLSETNGRWAKVFRGPLPGAGKWTHQYGEPGNTACSDDKIVSGTLGLLWFGEPGPAPMVNRHNAAAAPLAVNGRMFIQGENNVMVYDSYNGTLLWKRDIEGAMRDRLKRYECSNIAADDESFFVGVGDRCLRLDAATGKTIATYDVPQPDGKSQKWGHIACSNGILFGSAMTAQGVSDEIFAYDIQTEKMLWSYGGSNIGNLTIAIGDGWIFFVDSSISPAQREEFLSQDKSQFRKLQGKDAEAAAKKIKEMDLRLAVALDARTGGKLWENAVEVTDCSRIGIGGGELTTMYNNGIVVLCGANANGHYWRQFLKGEFNERRLVALSAKTGDVVWAIDANYRHRPVVIGDTILAEPWKYELKTGRQVTRANPVTGVEEPWQFLRPGHHCGAISACSDMLLLRSGFTSYYDLQDDSGIRHFSGHRLGCWINAIPADGLALMPEASAGCTCLYPIRCTVVLEPRPDYERWSIYSAGRIDAPVEHMAINLGAPGDRRDDQGTLWMSYPRPGLPGDRSAMGFTFSMKTEFADGGSYVSRSLESNPVDSTVNSWLFNSCARGLNKCSLPLSAQDTPPAEYTVRLYFTNLHNAQTGKCVFDIKLQGQTVAAGIEITTETNRGIVKEFKGITVDGDLLVELTPKTNAPSLCGIEVLRQGDIPKKIAAN